MLTNASSMVAATLTNSLLGVAFWLVAAHHFSKAAVGVAGAAVSALLLIGHVGTLGTDTLLLGELPRRPKAQRALLNAALAASGMAALMLGVGFALAAPLVSPHLAPMDETSLAVAAFACGAGLTSVAYVLDQALIGMLHGGLQLVRNAVFAAAKLLILVAVAISVTDPGPASVYSAWGAGIAVSMLVLIRVYATRQPGESIRPDFPLLFGMRRLAASHAVVNFGLGTADLALPIIVVTLLTPSENGGFYIAWLVVNLIVMIPVSLGNVLYALGSAETARFEERLRFSLGLSFALGALANVVLIGAAGPILEVFGHAYAASATTSLQVLALGVFPLTVKQHFIAVHRTRRTLRRAMPLTWAGVALELGGGAVGAVAGGVTGVAIGWLAGLLVEATLMGPDVLRASMTGTRLFGSPSAAAVDAAAGIVSSRRSSSGGRGR
jgi:O-antigen/teichoic acid export membrane protein